MAVCNKTNMNVLSPFEQKLWHVKFLEVKSQLDMKSLNVIFKIMSITYNIQFSLISIYISLPSCQHKN